MQSVGDNDGFLTRKGFNSDDFYIVSYNNNFKGTILNRAEHICMEGHFKLRLQSL